jgi:outer membrane protein TolC
MPATRILAFVALLSAAALVSNCAVGPDFKPATPPEVDRYTREPLPAQTMSTSVAGGQAQRFVKDLDIPAEWWTLFHSPKLNGLIEQSLKANPNLQATMAALRIAQENVRAQEGKFLPLVQGNFNPTRQQST